MALEPQGYFREIQSGCTLWGNSWVGGKMIMEGGSSMANGAVGLHTPLCDVLGIRYPIIQAPMAGMTTPELVASVSNAGGLGMLGVGRMSAEEITAALDATYERTEGVFGVNYLIAPESGGNTDVAAVQRFLDRYRGELGLPSGSTELNVPESEVSHHLDLALEAGVRVVSFALADPGDMVERTHRAGALAIVTVTTVDEARIAAERGADVIVAQGYEAGGHRSRFNIDEQAEILEVGGLALVPQVVDAVDVPVVASGGIMDGRGIVAALALGAQGVQMGTRFLGARESGASAAYRQRLLAATSSDTVVTRSFTGRPARAVANRLTRDMAGENMPALGWPLQSIAASDVYGAANAQGNLDFAPVYAGQGVGMFQDGQSAMAIVEELVAEAEQVLARLAG